MVKDFNTIQYFPHVLFGKFHADSSGSRVLYKNPTSPTSPLLSFFSFPSLFSFTFLYHKAINEHYHIHPLIQDIIDVVLECAWRICKTKGHDQVFVEFCPCAESGFPLFTLCHPDVVECRDNVKLGVLNCLAELIQGFLDQWQKVTVLDSDGVQASIVHTEMQSTSWLSDKENRCSGR